MKKYLVEIEFRYNDAPSDGRDYSSRNKNITIGVYDDFDVACMHGNKLMETLESRFPLHQFPDGRNATKERFSRNGGCFGLKHDLISNLAYLKTPFAFFARIVTLNHDNIDGVINEVINSSKRYRDYILSEKELD